MLSDNVVDAPYPFFAYTPPAIATLTNNTKATVPRVAFRSFMGSVLDEDYRRLEWWTDRATRAPGSPIVTYPLGALVMHSGVLYEALAQNAEKKPDENAAIWKPLAAPADDVRLASTSPHSGLGVRWPPPP